MIDLGGYRHNVGIILADDEGHLFWGKRIGHDAWQFPQGGLSQGETPEECMFRELHEEIGLEKADVEILGATKGWLHYRLPKHMLRYNSQPLVIGQKQKWFLLRLKSSEQKIRLDLTSSPEFDSWRWVDYWHPLKEVIYFKRDVYRTALKELEYLLFPKRGRRYR